MYNLCPRDEELEKELFGQENTQRNGKEVLVALDSNQPHPPPLLQFSDADLGLVVRNNLDLAHLETPNSLQKHSIPLVLQGHDLLIHAPKESGKTLALLLPTLAKLTQAPPTPRHHPECLILAPTRDCSIRIHQLTRKFSYRSHLKTVVLYGGAAVRQQITQVQEGCHVLVSTPGRLVDMLEREVVSLGEVRVLIVEEVSLLLDMGFEPQVRRIVGGVPHAGQRQTLMSTVAFPKEVELFAGDISSNCVKLGAKLAKTVNITQRVIQVEETQKKLKLIELLGTLEGFTLVFVERKKKVSEVYTYITENGIPCAALHGDMSSSDRDVSIKLSSSGKVKVLIATDITSRGIDLPNIKNIVNYDMPPEIDDYVYRMGKTGREESGTVISFLNRSNINIAHHLIRLLEDSNEPVESFLHQYTNL